MRLLSMCVCGFVILIIAHAMSFFRSYIVRAGAYSAARPTELLAIDSLYSYAVFVQENAALGAIANWVIPVFIAPHITAASIAVSPAQRAYF